MGHTLHSLYLSKCIVPVWVCVLKTCAYVIKHQRQDSSIRASVSSLKQDLSKSNFLNSRGGKPVWIVSPISPNLSHSLMPISQEEDALNPKWTPVAFPPPFRMPYKSANSSMHGFVLNPENPFTRGLCMKIQRKANRYTDKHTCIHPLWREFEQWCSKPCQSKKGKTALCRCVIDPSLCKLICGAFQPYI